MAETPEEAARRALDDALARAEHGPATCAALMRQAGQAFARLTSNDQASRLHAQLSRRHAERAARSWRP